MTNGATKHHIPLTKCHLQKLDSKKIDKEEEKYSNGYCHFENNGTVVYKKDVKER